MGTVNQEFKVFNIEIEEFPSRAEIEFNDDIKNEWDVTFAITKQWSTGITFTFGDNTVLTEYAYPLHSVLQELSNGIHIFNKSGSVIIPIYVMDCPGPDTIHHNFSIIKDEKLVDEGEIIIDWCEHLNQSGSNYYPCNHKVRLSQVMSKIKEKVDEYCNLLSREFPEFYPRWASGENPLYGKFDQHNR